MLGTQERDESRTLYPARSKRLNVESFKLPDGKPIFNAVMPTPYIGYRKDANES